MAPSQSVAAPKSGSLAGPLVISTMKNEGPYILEWIAYHRVIGFTDFLIYTNDCEDGTVEILEELTRMGLAQHEANIVLRRGPHKSALKAAQAHPMTAAADWILISDVDEFLNVHLGSGSVQDLIAHVPGADTIPVTWRLFSHDGQIEYEDVLLTERLTDAELPLAAGGWGGRFVKSLFRRADDLERFGLHGPKLGANFGGDFGPDYRCIAPDGRDLTESDNPTKPATAYSYEIAQVNHYAVRSVDGYLIKKDRGRANHVRQVLGTDYWQRMCRGGAKDISIHRHVDATRAEIERMRADSPALANLHDASVQWHHAKIAELRKIDDFADARAQIIALSTAMDHHNTAATHSASFAAANAAQSETAPPKPVPSTPVPSAPTPAAAPQTAAQIAQLCTQLRAMLDHVEPMEAAQNAHAHLDDIERGLFGRVNR